MNFMASVEEPFGVNTVPDVYPNSTTIAGVTVSDP
jgi:hypothetical protein